jgi:hypothetical protein
MQECILGALQGCFLRPGALYQRTGSAAIRCRVGLFLLIQLPNPRTTHAPQLVVLAACVSSQ